MKTINQPRSCRDLGGLQNFLRVPTRIYLLCRVSRVESDTRQCLQDCQLISAKLLGPNGDTVDDWY